MDDRQVAQTLVRLAKSLVSDNKAAAKLNNDALEKAFQSVIRKKLKYVTNVKERGDSRELVFIGQNLANALKQAGINVVIPSGQGNLHFEVVDEV